MEQIGFTPETSLRRERIEAALSEPPGTTFPETNPAGVSTKPVRLARRPRGFLLTPPLITNRLMGFVTEQRWQGYVATIEGDQFQAVVYDTSEEVELEEVVEFDRAEVAELMRPLIIPGAIFFWDIGFQIEPSGQRLRQSIISFPMIPVRSKEQRRNALMHAKRRFEDLGWESKAPDVTKETP
jgi:hypothetical protein